MSTSDPSAPPSELALVALLNLIQVPDERRDAMKAAIKGFTSVAELGVLTKDEQEALGFTLPEIARIRLETQGAPAPAPALPPDVTSNSVHRDRPVRHPISRFRDLNITSNTPSDVAAHPYDLSDEIIVHRRRNQPNALPTTLLNSTLARLCDDLRGISPNITLDSSHVILARELVNVVSDLSYNDEKPLTTALNTWFTQKFCLPGSRMRVEKLQYGCKTDGTLLYMHSSGNDAVILVREDKYNGCNADLQAYTYYLNLLTSPKNLLSASCGVCPAIMVTITGTDMTIGGCVFTHDGVVGETYFSTKLLPVAHDYHLRCEIVRVMYALQKAISELCHFYERIDTSRAQLTAIDQPFYTHHSQGLIRYQERVKDKLVFYALLNDREVVVKFTRRFSQDARRAHEYLASRGQCPALVSCEQIEGGSWTALVMDRPPHSATVSQLASDLDRWPVERRQVVVDRMRMAVAALHGQGLVHGDLRAPNILVDTDDRVFLIDFDWAGRDGIARYPLGMNHADVQWHEDARDGAPIACAHDDHMVALLASVLTPVL